MKEDFQLLKRMNDELREKRNQNFEGKWLKLLKILYSVENVKEGKYTIFNTEYGTVDFFPKANKLLIRKENKWIKPGLKFIINRLIKNQI